MSDSSLSSSSVCKTGVALLKERLWRPDESHLTTLPRWARPADGAKYWHIPRSAHTDGEMFRGDQLVRVTFWCGIGTSRLLSSFTNKTPREMKCATCEGRARARDGADGLVYRPRSDFDFPRLCPALCGQDRVCRFCDAPAKWRRNYCHYDEVQHRVGPLLSRYAPCPMHGWSDVKRAGDTLVCGNWHRCGHVLALITENTES